MDEGWSGQERRQDSRDGMKEARYNTRLKLVLIILDNCYAQSYQ